MTAIKLPSQLRLLFIDIAAPDSGNRWMFLVWGYLLITGLICISTYDNTSRPFNVDSNTRLIIGIIVSYISMSAIFHKLIATNVIEC